MGEETPEEVPANRHEDSQHSLWVDEFAPRHYTELLSDDVRPCTCSSVPGFLVARRGGSRIQPNNMSPAHSLLEWKAGLWCALLSCRWETGKYKAGVLLVTSDVGCGSRAPRACSLCFLSSQQLIPLGGVPWGSWRGQGQGYGNGGPCVSLTLPLTSRMSGGHLLLSLSVPVCVLGQHEGQDGILGTGGPPRQHLPSHSSPTAASSSG